ncbi:UDP-N-acetylmuramate--L-alanine ligase [Candidatus Cerribacteria bacterium 'Amazon FNV 2010 28 9']|uniref:UDP-N-acetylmuramate--L-alanine ligase n=1 Tax=Candidatus Cerribacteria bacterium 'Amazon FNV 2010 28 9' TaxID=2081795 RepID=A0A317JSE4_9BACT|nr:MAG: UDP-N-acetylmuramate--L-alanine ligase [Candidatus Cerribacteria bacterium 'Amazon FNV 2010 28 9']
MNLDDLHLLARNRSPKSLFSKRHIHLVGIKGVAVASLAQCLIDLGIRISGSDVEEEFVTQHLLEKLHIPLFVGFDPSHVEKDVDLVIYTGAHKGRQNSEVQVAIQRSIPIISQAEAIGQLMDKKKGVSVCGTGGKSTTSAMIAWIAHVAGIHPSFTVGVGNIPDLHKTGEFSIDERSQWFIAEADEYAVDPLVDHRPRFIFQHPQIIICTNLSYDHPDIYENFDQTKQTFLSFFNTLPQEGILILNGDDERLTSLIPKLTTKARVVLVGQHEGNDIWVRSTSVAEGKTQAQVTFHLQGKQKKTEEVILLLPGVFNMMNAAFAIAAAVAIGIPRLTAIRALAQFHGTMRRFEPKGNFQGIPCFDDYAHTPEEIETTLHALKEWYPHRKRIVIFQPHTYSRTKALFDQFSQSFHDADEIYFLDIFASAREAEDSSVSSDRLAEAVKKNESDKKVKNVKTVECAADVVKLAGPQSVIVTMGAGDVYKIWSLIELK